MLETAIRQIGSDRLIDRDRVEEFLAVQAPSGPEADLPAPAHRTKAEGIGRAGREEQAEALTRFGRGGVTEGENLSGPF